MAEGIIEVVGGVVRRDGKFLLGRRPRGKSQAGCWEFIGGKVEPGETPEAALVRECREEIALPVVRLKRQASVVHAYPGRTIRLTLFDCEPAAGAEPRALEHEQLGWFTADEARALRFCPADVALVPVVFGPPGGESQFERRGDIAH